MAYGCTLVSMIYHDAVISIVYSRMRLPSEVDRTMEARLGLEGSFLHFVYRMRLHNFYLLNVDTVALEATSIQ